MLRFDSGLFGSRSGFTPVFCPDTLPPAVPLVLAPLDPVPGVVAAPDLSSTGAVVDVVWQPAPSGALRKAMAIFFMWPPNETQKRPAIAGARRKTWEEWRCGGS